MRFKIPGLSRLHTRRARARRLEPSTPAASVDATSSASTSGGPIVPTMPPFTHFSNMQDFYRFEFLSDGYPGRAEPDGTTYPHPIYGTYALIDYLKQYEAKPRAELRDAISRVAWAAVSRMDELHGTLVFWYPANPKQGARLYADHYSGLTQSYYAVQLARAGKLLGDKKLLAAAERTFRSLLLPAEQGGVLHQSPYGPAIAEVPQSPHSWILNGWLSALASVHEYASITNLSDAESLLADSAAAMAQVLHLYDDPIHRTSRYGLTGFTYLRVRFDRAPEELTDVALQVPDEPTVPVRPGRGTRWQSFVFESDMLEGSSPSTSVRMNIVLSLASGERPNVLAFDLRTLEPTTVTVEAMVGRYSPTKSAPVESTWETVASLSAPRGSSSHSVQIPRHVVESACYPTNFVKKIHGANVNVYHTIHIQRLRQLSDATGVTSLRDWADTWERYIQEWANMPLYDGLAFRDPRSGNIRSVHDQ